MRISGVYKGLRRDMSGLLPNCYQRFPPNLREKGKDRKSAFSPFEWGNKEF